MQACSGSGTFYMLISLIGMLLIPGIRTTHDLLWPFIQVSPQISSPQEVFLGHSIQMTPISHPPYLIFFLSLVSRPLPYFLHDMYWHLTLSCIFIYLWSFVPLKCFMKAWTLLTMSQYLPYIRCPINICWHNECYCYYSWLWVLWNFGSFVTLSLVCSCL